MDNRNAVKPSRDNVAAARSSEDGLVALGEAFSGRPLRNTSGS